MQENVLLFSKDFLLISTTKTLSLFVSEQKHDGSDEAKKIDDSKSDLIARFFFIVQLV